MEEPKLINRPIRCKVFIWSRKKSEDNKGVHFTPTTMLTDTAEIQQNAMNWFYVFDSEYRGCKIRGLQWQLFLYPHVIQATFIRRITESHCFGKVHKIYSECLVNIAKSFVAFVR